MPEVPTTCTVAVSDLDPLIVTSPLPRSGTTLLQRLLCSAPNTLIYGEKAAQELEFFLNIHAFKVQEYNYRRSDYTASLEQVLRGDVNDWIPDLSPDVDGYLTALKQAAFAGVAYCRHFARAHGRPVWGFKYPAWSPAVLALLRRLMPSTRMLYITRDLLPCLESAKAQHMLESEQQLRELCGLWLDGMAFARELAGDVSVYALRYEDLVEQPAGTLAAIAAFTGAQGMDAAVLEHKVNIWRGRGFTGESRDGYIPPEPLSERELDVVAAAKAAWREPVAP